MEKDIQPDITLDMLPLAMNELAIMVMEQKRLPLKDALYYIYTSRLYQTLLDKEAKTWYMSTVSLYRELEKEKAVERKRETTDAKTLLFQIFCLELFRAKRQLSAQETLALFNRHEVFPFLEEVYDTLHTQSTNYILESIATYIRKKKQR